MEDFAELIDRLVYTRSRNAKLALIADYLRATPDPDRGWALAVLTGELDLPGIKMSGVRDMALQRFDEELYRLSRDFVGDSAETIALMWPEPIDTDSLEPPPPLGRLVDELLTVSKKDAPALLAGLMDRLDSNGRYALIKLATGALRIGVSARLAKTAFAQAFGLDADDVEQVWHALEAPYAGLFEWGEGGARPDPSGTPYFRPFMLAPPLEERTLDLADYAAEWKWDGIRVQIVHAGGETRVYSRGGDEISASFPELAESFRAEAVVDGELLVRGEDQAASTGTGAASFNALQKRLGRKTVSKKMRADYPAFVRLYDILERDGTDLRDKPWAARRQDLETLIPELEAQHFDLSTVLDVSDWAALTALRDGARGAAIEGLMLKRRDSRYQAGRRIGSWYKWKRDPLIIDCVLMYAQRGSGKRSSFYSDFTFGCWTEDDTLSPVGKAYFGFTDAELKQLDKFVRQNTINRFGPVREVHQKLVFEVAFDSVHSSTRHKSGVAMRFPRISRIRWDKPADEADRLETLRRLVT